MAELLETFMVLAFGVSWPISIYKSYTSKTAKGKSLAFLLLILFGYISGVAGKFISGNLTYVVAFYILNFVMVFIDILLYFRNFKIDQKSH